MAVLNGNPAIGNAWAIVALNSELDTTIDYVLSTDETTFLPVGSDIPNPLWVNDGFNTTPDANGEARYLPFNANNWNSAQVYIDEKNTVEGVRLDKAEYQRSNPQLNVEITRIAVSIAPQ